MGRCMYLHVGYVCMRVRCPQNLWILWSWSHSCELLNLGAELNSGPPEERQVLFGAEPSPQPSPFFSVLPVPTQGLLSGHAIASSICSHSGALQQKRTLTTLITSHKIRALKFRRDNRMGTEAFLEVASWSWATIGKDLNTDGGGVGWRAGSVFVALSEDLG